MKKYTRLFILASLFAAISGAYAQDNTTATTPTPTAAVADHQWQAETVDPKALRPRRHHPLISFVKALDNEVDYRVDEAAKDMVFVFSAQPIDPYDKKAPPPTDQPYELTRLRLANGSLVSVVKFPDGSERVIGGENNGAVLLPTSDKEFQIKFADGKQGKLVQVSPDVFQIIRPDNSTTTVTRHETGKYAVYNDHMQYPNEAVPLAAGKKVEFR